MSPDKPLVWLHGRVRTPPFSPQARIEAGGLLRLIQQGVSIGLPHSRPMPLISPGCHELRVADRGVTWRIVYRIDSDAVVIVVVFSKKTRTTPRNVIATCRERLKAYDLLAREREEDR